MDWAACCCHVGIGEMCTWYSFISTVILIFVDVVGLLQGNFISHFFFYLKGIWLVRLHFMLYLISLRYLLSYNVYHKILSKTPPPPLRVNVDQTIVAWSHIRIKIHDDIERPLRIKNAHVSFESNASLNMHAFMLFSLILVGQMKQWKLWEETCLKATGKCMWLLSWDFMVIPISCC